MFSIRPKANYLALENLENLSSLIKFLSKKLKFKLTLFDFSTNDRDNLIVSPRAFFSCLFFMPFFHAIFREIINIMKFRCISCLTTHLMRVI